MTIKASPAVSEPAPPLSEETLNYLLLPHETLRDPVQHDITLTALERAIIDTRAFQRLRGLNQLGPTQLVYPGAVHTRFMHSIGTVHCADQLVQTVNRNYSVYSQRSLLPIQAYPHLLVRLCALLHDLAHIPFGHTLEDEGNLASPEWADTNRGDYWLADGKEVPVVIHKFLSDLGTEATASKRLIEDLRQYVLFRGSPIELMKLEYPFVVDLVGNTLCADLLDYLDRDMYFCGLRERSGDRVLKYLAVVRVYARAIAEGGTQTDDSKSVEPEVKEFLPSENPDIGKGRVVLLAFRFEREHSVGGNLKPLSQPEILSEALDLLRRRFALAQKVYFHRTKIAASAMLISAVGSASFGVSSLYNISDAELLASLRADTDPRAKHLVDAYDVRRLYKPVFRLNYRDECDTDPSSKILWREKYPDEWRKPAWRLKAEKQLETYAQLPPGSFAIYCPDRKMSIKEFEVLVQSEPAREIKQLGDILDANRRLEMEALNRPFPHLWNLLIFVDPGALDVSRVASQEVQDFNALCEAAIGFPNDILALRGKGRALLEQLSNRVIQEWDQSGAEEVPYRVFEELVRADYRGVSSSLIDIEDVRNRLRAIMGPQQLDLGTGQGKK